MRDDLPEAEGLKQGAQSAGTTARHRTLGWKSNWGLILAALAALAVIGAGMAYTFTGDFTGLVTFGVRGAKVVAV
ncbi:MAG TPA: hypothetical protein VFJ49_12010 [Methyloceanibacter sp.]|nr:hypothetical protein [Methyloceanibacter sp.]